MDDLDEHMKVQMAKDKALISRLLQALTAKKAEIAFKDQQRRAAHDAMLVNQMRLENTVAELDKTRAFVRQLQGFLGELRSQLNTQHKELRNSHDLVVSASAQQQGLLERIAALEADLVSAQRSERDARELAEVLQGQVAEERAKVEFLSQGSQAVVGDMRQLLAKERELRLENDELRSQLVAASQQGEEISRERAELARAHQENEASAK